VPSHHPVFIRALFKPFLLTCILFHSCAQVFVNVVHVGVGPVSQSDIDLAQACGACIVGFNVKNPPSSVTQAATRASIQVLNLFLLCQSYDFLLMVAFNVASEK